MGYIDEVLELVNQQNPDQKEFQQAVKEVLSSLRPVIEKNEERYRREALLEKMVNPERIIMFRVPWQDDAGNTAQDQRVFGDADESGAKFDLAAAADFQSNHGHHIIYRYQVKQFRHSSGTENSKKCQY